MDARPADELATEPEPPRRRRRWVAWALVTVVLIALVATGAVIQVESARAFDAAVLDQRQARAEASTSESALGATSADVAAATQSAGEIVDVAGDGLVDASTRTGLADAAAASAAVLADADSLLADGFDPPIPAKPLWPWDLRSSADALHRDADSLLSRAADAAALEESLGAQHEALTVAVTALSSSVPASATALESANVSAVALVVLDFRDAAEAAASQKVVGTGAVVAYSTYAEMAANLARSQQSELDGKAGELMATRLEIEAYARSIAGGVVLDFDWAPLVNGLGGERGLSGTATWNTARGGFSTITLSDSIAETWPSADARAIVAHEVGHSITSKCHLLFDSANQAANEEWATAWAISMGHTAEGNGTQAYGYPSQAMIDAATGCR